MSIPAIGKPNRLLILVTLVGLLLILMACAPAATPAPPTAMPVKRTHNLEGETITFYHFGDITGPYAAITTPLINGFNDAVKRLNAEGGIRGAQVKVEWADTGGKLEESISIYNRFREAKPKPIILSIYSSGDLEALRDRFVEDKIPTLSAGVSGAGLYPPGYAFGIVPIYSDQFGLFVNWLDQNRTSAEPIKVAILTWDTAYGRAAYTPEAIEYAKSKGVEIVTVEYFAVGAPDVTTQILAAEAAGAEWIYTNTLAHGPAQILKDATSLGLRDKIKIAGNNWAMDLSMLALAKGASEGMIGLMANAWWGEEDNPGIQIVTQEFQANERGPAERNVAYILAFTLVDVAREAIERAIDEVGFDNLDGEAVYQQLQTLKGYKPLGGLAIFDYGPNVRSTRTARIVQAKGGTFVPLTNWMQAPDLRPKE